MKSLEGLEVSNALQSANPGAAPLPALNGPSIIFNQNKMKVFKTLSDQDWPQRLTCLLILSNAKSKQHPAITCFLPNHVPKQQNTPYSKSPCPPISSSATEARDKGIAWNIQLNPHKPKYTVQEKVDLNIMSLCITFSGQKLWLQGKFPLQLPFASLGSQRNTFLFTHYFLQSS